MSFSSVFLGIFLVFEIALSKKEGRKKRCIVRLGIKEARGLQIKRRLRVCVCVQHDGSPQWPTNEDDYNRLTTNNNNSSSSNYYFYFKITFE